MITIAHPEQSSGELKIPRPALYSKKTVLFYFKPQLPSHETAGPMILHDSMVLFFSSEMKDNTISGLLRIGIQTFRLY